jgi:hypothetical protein
VSGIADSIGQTASVSRDALLPALAAAKSLAAKGKQSSFLENLMGIPKWLFEKAVSWAKSMSPFGGAVTPYLRDNGGYLPEGLSLVNNQTGDKELVLNKDQQDRMFGRSAPLIGEATFHNSNAREVID